MIEITYLDAVKQERKMTFESYQAFEQSQQACLIGVADYYPVQITDATFEQETKDGLVLVDFWATWCGPCRMQGPVLDRLSEEVSEDKLKIVKIDVDENPLTARSFGIMSIPTLLFKKDGKVVKQVAGVHTAEQIKAIVAELS